jgi:methylated-DNA-protein-cysteine methyltransferase-like protein
VATADFSDVVYRVVRRIPAGRVATYGEVAEAAGRPGAARAVGGVLRSLPEGLGVPWWRVLGSGGRITIPRHRHHDRLQRSLLAGEGVTFGPSGKVDMARHGWSRTSHID